MLLPDEPNYRKAIPVSCREFWRILAELNWVNDGARRHAVHGSRPSAAPIAVFDGGRGTTAPLPRSRRCCPGGCSSCGPPSPGRRWRRSADCRGVLAAHLYGDIVRVLFDADAAATVESALAAAGIDAAVRAAASSTWRRRSLPC